MNILKLIITSLIVVILSAGFASAQYFYGGGNRIPLKIDSTKIMIKFDDQITEIDQQTILN